MNDVQRLYPTIKPSNYKLTLTPNLENFTFTGHEVIGFEITASTTDLVFHARDLTIVSAKLKESSVTVSDYKLNAEDQTVTFMLNGELQAGSYQLELDYEGPIRDDLHGWYRSKYTVDGQEKWLAVTQLEAISAREVFVCIDESLLRNNLVLHA